MENDKYVTRSECHTCQGCMKEDYTLNYYVTRSDSHACQGCRANLDLYGEVVDRCEDDEWVVRKCGHCGCLSLIDLPKYEGS
jgi:hypothetical protein